MLFKIIASGVFTAVPLDLPLPAGDTVLVGAEAIKAAGVEGKLPVDAPPERVLGIFTSAPTGGYALKVEGVEETPDSLVVKARLLPPEGVAIQVITHPWVLLLIEKPIQKPVKLELVR